MNLKTLLRAISIKARHSSIFRKGLFKSYVSVFLVFVLTIGSVAAWFTASTTAEFSTDILSMNGATGMRNDRSKKVIDEIKIPAFTLEEASSVDGRNIFFPSSIFDNASDSTSSSSTTSSTALKGVTTGMVYREANAGDKGVRYAYAEGSLSGSSDNTKVWIRSYKVMVGNDVYEASLHVDNSGSASSDSKVFDMQHQTKDCPVRIAIISDSGDSPKVIDPSALVNSYSINTDSVYYVTQQGKPTTRSTALESFASYYYGTNNPLFTLQQGETKNIAIVAWLEGSHPKAREYEGEQLSIDIEIETNVSDMGYIYFHDWTANDDAGSFASNEYQDKAVHWLSRDNAIIAVSYTDTQNTPTTADDVVKTTVMTRMAVGETSSDGYFTATDNYTYMAAIPLYVVTNISFYRLASMDDHIDYPNDILKGNIYNSWHTRSGINAQLSTKSMLQQAQNDGLTNIYNVDENAKAWVVAFGKGGLSESRVISGVTHYHYYAIRGNAYGSIPRNNSKKYLYWLSPCVGYWGDYQGNITGTGVSIS